MNVWETSLKRNVPKFAASPAHYYDWRTQNKVFSVMGAYQQSAFNLATSEGGSERYRVALCDSGFFSTLQASPALGPLFTEDEEAAGSDDVIILNNCVWRQRFGADPNIIGQSIHIDGRARTMIGVMPERFEYPPQSSMWAPFGFDEQTRARRSRIAQAHAPRQGLRPCPRAGRQLSSLTFRTEILSRLSPIICLTNFSISCLTNFSIS